MAIRKQRAMKIRYSFHLQKRQLIARRMVDDTYEILFMAVGIYSTNQKFYQLSKHVLNPHPKDGSRTTNQFVADENDVPRPRIFILNNSDG